MKIRRRMGFGSTLKRNTTEQQNLWKCHTDRNICFGGRQIERGKNCNIKLCDGAIKNTKRLKDLHYALCLSCATTLSSLLDKRYVMWPHWHCWAFSSVLDLNSFFCLTYEIKLKTLQFFSWCLNYLFIKFVYFMMYSEINFALNFIYAKST